MSPCLLHRQPAAWPLPTVQKRLVGVSALWPCAMCEDLQAGSLSLGSGQCFWESGFD